MKLLHVGFLGFGKICKGSLFVIRLGICTYDIICVICSHNGNMFTPGSSQIYFGRFVGHRTRAIKNYTHILTL